MLSTVYYGPRDLRAEERPVPAPGPGEVLLRVSHVGICGSDLEAYQNGGYAEGTIIGHEFVGPSTTSSGGQSTAPAGT